MLGDQLLFWASILLLGYTYAGYPALLFAWARLRARRAQRRAMEPSVTVLIAAHNEGKRIVPRLENILSLDYPRDRVDVLIASDGSSDDTVERARAYEQARVQVVEFRTRRGKPAVLNELVKKAQGEIVVLADARQRFERGALRALLGRFSDSKVGAVSGELILTQNAGGTAVGEGVGFYWRYEKFIRQNESLVDSAVGATGAIYAIRRELFESIPEDTILDDVLIPMRIARRGYRVVFESAARAYDRAAATAHEEFTRKVRTIAGNFQLLAREPWLLNPFRNRLWLQTVSHKALRLLTPVFLLAAFTFNLPLLADSLFYQCALAGQCLFYTSALGGFALRNKRRKIPLLSVPYVLCLLSCATVVAFFRFLTGRQRVTWQSATAT